MSQASSNLPPRSGGACARSARLALMAITPLLCLLASGCTDRAVSCTARRREPLRGGVSRPDAAFAAVEASLLAVRLVTTVEGHDLIRLCSATHVGGGLVVTARHCFEGASRWTATVVHRDAIELEVERETTCGDVSAYSTEREAELHPALDAARLRAPSLAGAPAAPVLRHLPAAGTRALLGGYGLDETGNFGTRAFLDTQLVESSDERLVTDSGEQAGACLGDSGGPLFVMDGEQPTLAGVLARGSPTCTGRDEWTPTAVLADWLTDGR